MRLGDQGSSNRRLVVVACAAAMGGLVAGASLSALAVPNPDAPYAKLDVFAKVLAYVKNNYVEEVDESRLVYGAVRGLVGTLDPHSSFMEPDEYRALQEGTSGEFAGIGVELEKKDGELLVKAVLEETPAARGGIRAGDFIRAIDGAEVAEMSLSQAGSRLKGRPGSSLRLTLWRPSFKAPREVMLVRERIRRQSVESRLVEGRIGYARIKSFQDRTARQLQKALKELRESAGENYQGLVLDLRDNPGGLLEQGVQVADLFLDSGLIVTTRGRSGRNAEEERAVAAGTEPSYPLVVLVNASTASASEIVAGALQDHERAVLFGVPTYGKGSVQTVIELDDGSGLKLTIARYYTPKGRSIQESGIVPDVTVHASKSDEGLTREVMLPGHMPGEKALQRSITVDASRVVPARASGSSEKDDPQLEAALGALFDWERFSRSLAGERARLR